MDKSKIKDFYMKNESTVLYTVSLLEDIESTEEEVEEFLYRGGTISSRDSKVITNMKSAMDYMLDTIECDLTTNYMEDINGEIVDGTLPNPLLEGQIRVSEAYISGSIYKPPVRGYKPTISVINGLISNVNTLEDILIFYIKGMKEQFFNDGNKRTMYVICNKLLLEKYNKFLVYEINYLDTFLSHLKEYYELSISNEVGYLDELCSEERNFVEYLKKNIKNVR